MCSSLGDRIKTIRKEQKLTQAELAYPEMTKSMLSQIENGLAMPSMKNLQYIARKLNKSVSYILEDTQNDAEKKKKNNGCISKVIMKLQMIDDLIKDGMFKEALSSLDNLQSGILPDHNNKLMGDILSKKGECLLHINEFDDAEKYLIKASDIYLENSNYTEAAKAYMKISLRSLKSFNYGECIKIYKKVGEIYNKTPNKDFYFEIELLNNLAKAYSVIGNFERAVEYLNSAMNISNITGIYYQADDIHRLTAVLYFYQGDLENYRINIEKAKQFANFTGNKRTMYLIMNNKAMYENYLKNYEKALEYLQRIEDEKYGMDYFYYREKSVALYHTGAYKEALNTVLRIDYSVSVNYRIDYLILWSSKVYEGMIYYQLGQPDKALESILQGIEKMRIFGDSKLLSFGLESASEIYHKNGDMEKAYMYIKEAKEVSDAAVKDKIYF